MCLVALVVWEWFSTDPIIDVRLFRNRNFLSANVMMFMAGVVLFSEPRHAAAVSAEPDGLLGRDGGPGAVGRRCCVLLIEMPIVGAAHDTSSGALPHRVRLAADVRGMFYTVGASRPAR